MIDIHIETAGGSTVARPVGSLDVMSATQFRMSMAAAASAPRLVVDLSGVSFVDSAGLGALVGAVRRAQALGGRVVLASPRPGVSRVLHDTGFDRIAPVAPTLDDAITLVVTEEVTARVSNATA